MVDKVKPLKYESPSTGGVETDIFPTETDPTEDYLSAKGISLEHSDNTRLEVVGGHTGYYDTASGSKSFKSLKCMDFLFADQSNPFFNTGSVSFQIIARFIWKGTNTLAAPAMVKAIAFMSSTSANSVGEIRLFDVTNNVILGTATEIVGIDPAIYSISTSGWSTGESIVEVQIRRSGTVGQIRISNLEIEW